MYHKNLSRALVAEVMADWLAVELIVAWLVGETDLVENWWENGSCLIALQKAQTHF